jgi:8-oxo-dGTP pyrophosphatase MutT (NUDIX family)
MSLKKVEAAQISAAGIIFVHDGQFLLIMRARDVVSPSVWCGAGGKIEPGETPEQAAIRESEEEIGFPSDLPMELIPLYVFNSDSLVFHNYIGWLKGDRFDPKLNWESDGWAWFTMENLPQNGLHFGFQAILSDPMAASLLNRTIEGSVLKRAE